MEYLSDGLVYVAPAQFGYYHTDPACSGLFPGARVEIMPTEIAAPRHLCPACGQRTVIEQWVLGMVREHGKATVSRSMAEEGWPPTLQTYGCPAMTHEQRVQQFCRACHLQAACNPVGWVFTPDSLFPMDRPRLHPLAPEETDPQKRHEAREEERIRTAVAQWLMNLSHAATYETELCVPTFPYTPPFGSTLESIVNDSAIAVIGYRRFRAGVIRRGGREFLAALELQYDREHGETYRREPYLIGPPRDQGGH